MEALRASPLPSNISSRIGVDDCSRFLAANRLVFKRIINGLSEV